MTEQAGCMELLNRIQQELHAPKDLHNEFGNYAYRSCESILSAVKPLLGDGTLTITDEIVLIGDRYYVRAAATLHCSDRSVSCSAYAREQEQRKGMDEAQLTGATSSYARKYALNGLFAIDDTKDADSLPRNGNGGESNGNGSNGQSNSKRDTSTTEPGEVDYTNKYDTKPETAEKQRKAIWETLLLRNENNPVLAEDHLERLTTFTSRKDNKEIKGKRQINRLSERASAVAYGQLKESDPKKDSPKKAETGDKTKGIAMITLALLDDYGMYPLDLAFNRFLQREFDGKNELTELSYQNVRDLYDLMRKDTDRTMFEFSE